jgi:hypothetical protein
LDSNQLTKKGTFKSKIGSIDKTKIQRGKTFKSVKSEVNEDLSVNEQARPSIIAVNNEEEQ